MAKKKETIVAKMSRVRKGDGDVAREIWNDVVAQQNKIYVLACFYAQHGGTWGFVTLESVPRKFKGGFEQTFGTGAKGARNLKTWLEKLTGSDPDYQGWLTKWKKLKIDGAWGEYVDLLVRRPGGEKAFELTGSSQTGEKDLLTTLLAMGLGIVAYELIQRFKTR